MLRYVNLNPPPEKKSPKEDPPEKKAHGKGGRPRTKTPEELKAWKRDYMRAYMKRRRGAS
jgi:hypothetical protein